MGEQTGTARVDRSRHLKSGYSLRVVDDVNVVAVATIDVVFVCSAFAPWRCHMLMCLMTPNALA